MGPDSPLPRAPTRDPASLVTLPLERYSPEWIPGFPFQSAGAPSTTCVAAESLGALSGAETPPAWQFDPGIPPSLRPVALLFLHSGFRIDYGAEGSYTLLALETGLWVGSAPEAALPELFSPLAPPRREGALSWVDTATQRIALLSIESGKHRHLALGLSTPGDQQLAARLHQALRDPEAHEKRWQDEIALRHETLQHIDHPESPSLGPCLERLYSLIPPSPPWPTWPREFDTPIALQDLLALLPPLAPLHPDAACAMLDRIAELPATPDGFLPIAPGSSLPAWPTLALSLLELPPSLYPHPSFQRALDRATDHLDAWLASWQVAGGPLPVWPDPDAALTPEVVDPDLHHTDLAALLVAEADAWLKLRKDPTRFSPRIRPLADTLLKRFWSPTHHALADQSPDGTFAKRLTLGSLLPLLWPQLPADRRRALWKRATAHGGLRAPNGLRQWESRPGDPVAPPVRLEIQLLFLPALAEVPADAAAVLAEAWSHWTPAPGRLPTPLAAALHLRLLPFHTPGRIELGRYPAWVRHLEHHRRNIVAAVAALALLLPSLFGLFYSFRDEIGTQQQIALSGHAETLLAFQRHAEAEELYTRLIEHARGAKSNPRFPYLRGNARHHLGRLEEALADYREAVRLDPDMTLLAAHWNLAQTLRELGRNEEAIPLFQALAAEFGDQIPGFALRAANAIHLCRP